MISHVAATVPKPEAACRAMQYCGPQPNRMYVQRRRSRDSLDEKCMRSRTYMYLHPNSGVMQIGISMARVRGLKVTNHSGITRAGRLLGD
jgi:hypothetical protein